MLSSFFIPLIFPLLLTLSLSLAECQRPNRDHLRRQDTQLSVWVLEARNLTPKKSYYCEIYLNGVHYAQTCVKVMNDLLFWGEQFVFE